MIQAGISLHRSIDEFTDRHEATSKAKSYFRSDYGLYSGAITDIIYDYFLANDQEEFTAENLMSFSTGVYSDLDLFSIYFPDKFRMFFHYMRLQNWLYHYRYQEGIQNSLRGLAHRAAYLTETEKAFKLFQEHLSGLAFCYHEFFPELKSYSRNRLSELTEGWQ
jgi:acyl carrier protein phosphodiesterase